MGSRRPSLLRWLPRVFVLLVIVAALAGYYVFADYRRWESQPLLESGSRVELEIPRGTAWPAVVELLATSGVVDCPLYFEVWGRLRKLPPRVKAGQYVFVGPVGLDDLERQLERGGGVTELTVTIPEGYNLWAIAASLDDDGVVEADELLEAATDPELLAAAQIDARSFEGFLFPDTYRFTHETSAEEVVLRLHARWKEVWRELIAENAPPGEFDTLELVTLASIVEKETALATERADIARVFYNRLERGMRLQSDPTCVYSAERWRATPTPDDCKDPANPYSTYVVDALPPGPIANPGREALRAVLDPADGEATEYLYFVAKRDGTGAHHFSRTLAEHNRAVDRYLR